MILLLGALLTILAMDLLAAAIVDNSTPPGLGQSHLDTDPTSWPSRISQEAKGNECRELVLQIRGATLTGRYDLYLPSDHPIHQAIRDGAAQARPMWFAHDVLGDVNLLGSKILFADDDERDRYMVDVQPPVILPATKSKCGPADPNRVLIRTTFWQTVLDQREQLIAVEAGGQRVSKDIITIVGGDVRVDAGANQHARQLLEDRVELTRQSDGTTTVTVHTKEHLPEAWGRVWFQTPVAERILPYLLASIPFILLLTLLADLRKERKWQDYGLLVRLSGSFLALSVGVGCAGALLDATQRFEYWHADLLARRFFDLERYPRDGVGVTALLFALACICWPAAVLFGRHRNAARSGSGAKPDSGGLGNSARQLLLGLLAAESVTFVGALLTESWWGGPSRSQLFTYAAIAIATACGYVGLRLVVAVWLSGLRAALVAAAASTAAVWYTVADQLIFDDESLTVIGVLVFALAGTLLVLATAAAAAKLAIRLTSANSRPGQGSGGTQQARLVLPAVAAIAATVAISAPVLWILARRPPPTWQFDAYGLVAVAGHVLSIVSYLALAALLVVLADLCAPHGPAPSHGLLRRAGVVYVALTFYWSFDQLVYLPVSLMLGIALTYIFTLPAERDFRDTFTPRVAVLAKRLMRERDSIEARQRDLRPPRSGKGYAAYAEEQRSLDNERRLIRLKDDASPTRTTRRQDERWAHGLAAAAVGALLGLPWAVAQIIHITEWTGDGLFTAFGLVDSVGWELLQWPIFGFFFGYFYTEIRGGSGLPKGLVLFLTVTLPPLVLQALADIPGSWSAYVAWTLQVLIFAVLLGLVAGDAWILDRAGVRWPHLLDVHRKRYIVGVVAAVLVQAGIVAALVSGLLPVLLVHIGVMPSPSSQ
ncbi:hypothetical protein OG558_15480 [Kribbella sp. NBC_01510]|uniref:hypothetical protein n=1 Tax=Kribbella sp. NBC_01510 TaxID=2903581 RepID=UPI003870BD77